MSTVPLTLDYLKQQWLLRLAAAAGALAGSPAFEDALVHQTSTQPPRST